MESCFCQSVLCKSNASCIIRTKLHKNRISSFSLFCFPFFSCSLKSLPKIRNRGAIKMPFRV